MLKISIITPSYNQGKFIENSIESVLNQNYSNFEHIIVDGGSDDDTIDILKKYPHLKWISEKDKGISDALNKAIKMATGDIIGWLNCDDYYIPGTFKKVNLLMEKDNVKWIIGNNQRLYESTGKIEKTKFKAINSNTLKKNCDLMRTNAAFYKKEVFDTVGYFDLKFKMVMDYDFFVRLAKQFEPLNIDMYFHVFRIHIEQTTTYKNTLKQYRELCAIFKREKYYRAMLIKTVKITKSYLKRKLKHMLIKLGIINQEYAEIPYSTRDIK